jgi:hypothetical protein
LRLCVAVEVMRHVDGVSTGAAVGMRTATANVKVVWQI